MKKLVFIIIFLSVHLVSSQYEKGVLYLHDGSTLIGLIKEKNLGGIKFKENKDSKSVSYDYKKLTGYKIGEKKYQYKYLESGFPPSLFQLVIEGKMSLFAIQRANTGFVMGPNGTMTAAGANGTSTIYYIETFKKFIKIGLKLKQKHWHHFSACPGLYKKIKSKEFEKTDLEGIVNYYNTHYYDEQ